MSIACTVNGVTYTIPELSDQNWGPDTTNWINAMTSGVLQKAGGTFTLTAEVNFGATYGLKTAYYKSQATNPASAGIIRLGNAETISWRNAANSADISLTVNASNAIQFNSLTLVDLSSSQTLTNKTLTSPIISTISNTGTLTLPTSTDTLVGRATTDTLTNKTLTSPVISTIVNSGTLTLPTSTDTLVGKATTDTLTNKTLTSPIISTISNTGTLTLPTSTDTLVGKATTDILTNKTISGSSNTLSNVGDTSLSVSYLKADGTRALTANWAAGAFSATHNSVAVGSSANTISALRTVASDTTFTFQTNGSTTAGSIAANQRWVIGSTVTEGQVHTISAVDTLGANATHLALSSGAAAQVPFKIAKDRNDGSINIAGGGASGNGGEVIFYGSTFGSGLSSQIRFLQGGTQVGAFDSSNLFTMGKSGETGTHPVNGAINPTLGIIGVTTNSSAAAGTVGETISSAVSGVSAGTSAQFANVTSISLTAGHWIVTGMVSTDANGATITNSTQDAAVSTNTGNTTTDHVVGDNQLGSNLTSGTSGLSRGTVIAGYSMKLTGTTTVYLKNKITYSVATPVYAGRLSAIRVR